MQIQQSISSINWIFQHMMNEPTSHFWTIKNPRRSGDISKIKTSEMIRLTSILELALIFLFCLKLFGKRNRKNEENCLVNIVREICLENWKNWRIFCKRISQQWTSWKFSNHEIVSHPTVKRPRSHHNSQSLVSINILLFNFKTRRRENEKNCFFMNEKFLSRDCL